MHHSERPFVSFHSRLAATVTEACSFFVFAAILCVFSVTIGYAQTAGKDSPVSDVNPLIGTGAGPGPYANSNGWINLFPGPVMPFGMVHLSPDTEVHGFGYHYSQGRDSGLQHDAYGWCGLSEFGRSFIHAYNGRGG